MVETMDEVLKVALAEPLRVGLPAATAETPADEPDVTDDTRTH